MGMRLFGASGQEMSDRFDIDKTDRRYMATARNGLEEAPRFVLVDGHRYDLAQHGSYEGVVDRLRGVCVERD